MKNVWILICMMGLVISGYGQDIGEEVKDKRVLSLKTSGPNGNSNGNLQEAFTYCHDTKKLVMWFKVQMNIPLEASSNAQPFDQFIISCSMEIVGPNGDRTYFSTNSSLNDPLVRDSGGPCNGCIDEFPMEEYLKIEFDLSDFIISNYITEQEFRDYYELEVGAVVRLTSQALFPIIANWGQEMFSQCGDLWPESCFRSNTYSLTFYSDVPDCKDLFFENMKIENTRVFHSKEDIFIKNGLIVVVDMHGRILFKSPNYTGNIREIPVNCSNCRIVHYERIHEFITNRLD